MTRRPAIHRPLDRRPPPLLAAALALLQLSCAAGSLPPGAASMPAARAALAPEYRIFYDALEDFGDWTLIEPFGYVFRPRVNFVAWRPYADGYWAPSDLYGWIWVSAEPFGWATYHYGEWAYDRFQGWIWRPGLDWGPAWVSWLADDEFVAWAPRMSRASDYASVPGGAFNFVAAGELPSTNLAAQVMRAGDLGERAAQVRPVENFVTREGVTFNRGPSLERIERSAGRLTRVRIEDLIPQAPTGEGRGRPGGRVGSAGPAASNEEAVAEARRAGAEAARGVRMILEEQGAAPPARLPMVRPIGVPAAEGSRRPAPARPLPVGRRSAVPDSAR